MQIRKGGDELWMKLISDKHSTHDIVIGAIYRHPTSDSKEFSDAFSIQSVESLTQNIVFSSWQFFLAYQQNRKPSQTKRTLIFH